MSAKKVVCSLLQFVDSIGALIALKMQEMMTVINPIAMNHVQKSPLGRKHCASNESKSS